MSIPHADLHTHCSSETALTNSRRKAMKCRRIIRRGLRTVYLNFFSQSYFPKCISPPHSQCLWNNLLIKMFFYPSPDITYISGVQPFDPGTWTQFPKVTVPNQYFLSCRRENKQTNQPQNQTPIIICFWSSLLTCLSFSNLLISDWNKSHQKTNLTNKRCQYRIY